MSRSEIIPFANKIFLGCDDQGHTLSNAFNVLYHDGFLHGQGVLTLEVVQKFFKEISEKPTKADLVIKEILDLCSPGKESHRLQAVLNLKYEDTKQNETYFHAVALLESNLESDLLTLTFADSAAEKNNHGLTQITIPVHCQGGKQKLMIGSAKDKWCLDDGYCYFLCF